MAPPTVINTTGDLSDPRPAYQQIAAHLRSWIASDSVEIGDALPPLSAMRRTYGQATMTIRQGIAVLVREGLVVSHQGQRSYVVKKPDTLIALRAEPAKRRPHTQVQHSHNERTLSSRTPAHRPAYIAWHYYPDTLALRLDGRVVTLTPSLAALMVDNNDRPLTSDPARDILQAEQDLRWRLRQASDHISRAAEQVADAKVRRWRALQHGLPQRLHATRDARIHQTSVTAHHNSIVRAHQAFSQVLAELRQWVITLGAPDGLLAQAASGWQRDPALPPWVRECHTGTSGALDDQRRWHTQPHTETAMARNFGTAWRRDPDDTGPLQRALDGRGFWRVDLTATGMLYASRWCPWQPPGLVWVLAQEVLPATTGQTLLAQLVDSVEHRITEPNSLILLAEAVRDWLNDQRVPMTPPRPAPHGSIAVS